MEDNVVRVVVGAVEGEGSVMQSHSVFNIEREENNALRALLNNVLNCCLRKRGGKPVVNSFSGFEGMGTRIGTDQLLVDSYLFY